MANYFSFYVPRGWRDNEEILIKRIAYMLHGDSALILPKDVDLTTVWSLDNTARDFFLYRKETSDHSQLGIVSHRNKGPFTKYELTSRYATHEQLAVLKAMILWRLNISEFQPEN